MVNMYQTYEELRIQNESLVLQLKEALLRIKELEDKLNTNSTNSSIPPSQDPFRKRTQKAPSGRRQGAQKGHSGHRRELLPIEQVQKEHNLKPDVCPNCRSNDFDSEVIRTDVRQVVELPEMTPEVTQYNIHTCRCRGCGKHVKAEIPREAQFGFGPRLMGLVTSLSGEFRLSKRQVTALMGKIGFRICSGSVCKIHARASGILQKPYEEIKAHTLNQDQLNVDETSWKTLKEKRWIWTGCGQDSVFFSINPHRSASAFQEIFGERKKGITVDRHGAYNVHKGSKQLCWAHADRDFEKIAGREGFDKIVGELLLQCKSTVFDLWHAFKAGQFPRDELIKRMEAGPKADLQLFLKVGAAHQDTGGKTKATCGDFFNRFEELWLFIYKEGVEPTNNAAERSLRHGVIWRKLSFGSQSGIGERFVERVMTVVMTLQQRAKNSFKYLEKCFRAFIQGGLSPPVSSF